MNNKLAFIVFSLLIFFSEKSWGQKNVQENVQIGELKVENTTTEANATKELAPEDPRMIFEGNVGRLLEKDILYGSNMIYDCEKQYFACVDLDSYEKCQERRESDQKSLKQKLSCAPLKKYQYLLDCSLAQSKYIENNRPVVFCLNY